MQWYNEWYFYDLVSPVILENLTFTILFSLFSNLTKKRQNIQKWIFKVIERKQTDNFIKYENDEKTNQIAQNTTCKTKDL